MVKYKLTSYWEKEIVKTEYTEIPLSKDINDNVQSARRQAGILTNLEVDITQLQKEALQKDRKIKNITTIVEED